MNKHAESEKPDTGSDLHGLIKKDHPDAIDRAQEIADEIADEVRADRDKEPSEKDSIEE